MKSHLLVAFAALLGLFEGPAEIACAAALVVTAAGGGLRTKQLNIADIGLLLWLIAGAIGAIGGAPRWGSEPNLRPLLALAYVLGRTAIADADPATVVRMGVAFVTATAANAAFGYVQVLIVDPGLERYIVGRARAAHLATGDGRLRMATGLFYNRMKLVHVGVVALGVAVIASEGARKRALWVALAVIVAGGVFLTYRRAAPAAWVVGMVALAMAMTRYKRAALISVIGGGLLALSSLAGYGRERIDNAGEDLGLRVEIWSAARRLIADHPLFGVGHGGYLRAVGPYLEDASSPDLVRNALTNPHNALLYVLAETGLVGFVGFAIAVGASVAALVLSVRADRESDEPEVLLDRAALVGIATLMVIGVVHAVLYHAPVAMLFWALLGVAAARLPAAFNR